MSSGVGIGNLTRSLAGESARGGTDNGARCHSDRATHGTQRRTGRCTTACADAFGKVVVAQVVIRLGIDDLGCALAGEPARDGADCRTGRHADRASHRAKTRAGDRPGRRAGTRAEHVLAFVVAKPSLEVVRVLVRARRHAHQDAAVLDAFLVVLDALFRDAPADQRADDAAGRRTGAGAGDRGGKRAGDDEAEARQRDGRADGGDRRGDRAEAAADRAADAGAFGRLRAELGLAAVGGREVALAGVVAHDDVDVVVAIAAVGDRL